MSTVDEKLDRVILLLEHMDKMIDDFGAELHEFHQEMKQEYAELNHQVDQMLEVFLCRKNA